MQPLDHLAYAGAVLVVRRSVQVGNEVMKSFALEKVMEEASELSRSKGFRGFWMVLVSLGVLLQVPPGLQRGCDRIGELLCAQRRLRGFPKESLGGKAQWEHWDSKPWKQRGAENEMVAKAACEVQGVGTPGAQCRCFWHP